MARKQPNGFFLSDQMGELSGAVLEVKRAHHKNNVITHNGYSNKGPPIIEVPIGVGAITCFTDNEIG